MKSLQIIPTILLLSFTSLVATAATFTGKVKAIHDGDTLTVILENGKASKVRLLGTDSPEVAFNDKSQGSPAFIARDYLKEILPVGSQIEIITNESGTDKYDRLLGTILLGDTDINLEMVRSGWSVFYLIAPYDKTTARNYSNAAKEAFEGQRGLYSNEYAETMLPYMFRMKYSGMKPHNLIGDISTKKLFVPEKMESVPVYHRIFFPSLEMARLRGFDW